jgi:hypothetical protein
VAVKLDLKHKLNLADALLAFERWSEGPVREGDIINTKNTGAKPLVRYSFVNQLGPKRFVKVFFDWVAEEELPEGAIPAVVLVTAYPVSYGEYLKFQRSPKELE